MKRILVTMIAVTVSLCGMSRAAGADPFKETPQEYNARAQWLRDAKFGVMICWNPSSVIGKEISWCRNDYGREKYDALYKEFKGERFNADEWIKLFHEAGIRYAVFVPKHHDGFCMFDTKTSDYNVMHSPFGRDFIKEVSDACARSDVRFCLYYSVLDWWNPAYSSNAGADLAGYLKVFKAHMTELLTKYGPVGYLWFDGGHEASWTHAYGREIYAFVRGLQPATLLGNRIEPHPMSRPQGPYCLYPGSFYDAPDAVGDFQEREMDLGRMYMGKAWDCCYNLSPNGWSWTPPMPIRPTKDLLTWLINCIGRDGAMLLGVGPRPDGTIEPAQAAAMKELGDWMKLNGEAVYGTRGGPFLPGEPNLPEDMGAPTRTGAKLGEPYLPSDWGVSTRKGNKVFLFITHWQGEEVTLPALPAKVKSARLITRGNVSVDQSGRRWLVRVPEQFHRPVATIVELTLDRDAMTLPLAAEAAELKPLSQGKPVTVSGEWPGREKYLSKDFANDGNFDTLWAGPEPSRDGWVQIDLGEEHDVDAALADDHSFNRARKFEVQAQVAGQWKTLVTGTTIGSKKYLSFTSVKARLFRLVIQEAIDTPVVNEFQLFGR